MPSHISVLTLNAWGTARWNERAPIVAELMRRFDPDLIALQEAPEPVTAAIAAAVPSHRRLEPTMPCENALFWRDGMFAHLAHGSEGLPHAAARRPLLWTRLRLIQLQRELVFSTAHFTWPGATEERDGGRSPRPEQARTVVRLLSQAADGAAILFTGDLNESVHPRRILAEAGLVDCFTALGLPCEPTRPAPPWDLRPAEVDDWIVASSSLLPRAAQVVRFHMAGLPASDHWPVAAHYQFAD